MGGQIFEGGPSRKCKKTLLKVKNVFGWVQSNLKCAKNPSGFGHFVRLEDMRTKDLLRTTYLTSILKVNSTLLTCYMVVLRCEWSPVLVLVVVVVQMKKRPWEWILL